MATIDADSINELIDDCTDIPHAVLASPTAPAPRREAAAWSVDDAALAQVHDLDEYV